MRRLYAIILMAVVAVSIFAAVGISTQDQGNRVASRQCDYQHMPHSDDPRVHREPYRYGVWLSYVDDRCVFVSVHPCLFPGEVPKVIDGRKTVVMWFAIECGPTGSVRKLYDLAEMEWRP